MGRLWFFALDEGEYLIKYITRYTFSSLKKAFESEHRYALLASKALTEHLKWILKILKGAELYCLIRTDLEHPIRRNTILLHFDLEMYFAKQMLIADYCH